MAIVLARWYWLRKYRTCASRRLFEGKYVTEVPADQGDLPWELRGQYQAVKFIGCGECGVVLEARSKQEANQEYAIKLMFPSAGCFTEDDLVKLDREVVCCNRQT